MPDGTIARHHSEHSGGQRFRRSSNTTFPSRSQEKESWRAFTTLSFSARSFSLDSSQIDTWDERLSNRGPRKSIVALDERRSEEGKSDFLIGEGGGGGVEEGGEGKNMLSISDVKAEIEEVARDGGGNYLLLSRHR